MIRPGLARISQLLKNTALPWKAIHVAGTNGKGSVCAYISAMLSVENISFGRFTSPHLIDRWDCIMINGKTIDRDLFVSAEDKVEKYNKAHGIGASEFELLTATAFTLFTQEKVKIGVVEVGMGGTEDATNILQDPAVTIITKIGMDHQKALGSTKKEITDHKAGILKPGVPCVVDGTNDQQVIARIQERASACCAGPLICVPKDKEEKEATIWNVLSKDAYEAHQQVHVSLAFEALSIALSSTHTAAAMVQLLPAVVSAVWPGRLQTISIKTLTGRVQDVLLDGAHNVQAAEVLRSYTTRKLRQDKNPVTWVIAISHGKEVRELLSCLLEPQDSLVACEFGTVSGMPWVVPVAAEEITSAAMAIGLRKSSVNSKADLVEALKAATHQAQRGPLVIAGSLYLVSDVLRLSREHDEGLLSR